MRRGTGYDEIRMGIHRMRQHREYYSETGQQIGEQQDRCSLDRNYQKAEAFVKKYGGKAYHTVEEAINAPEVEGVYIAEHGQRGFLPSRRSGRESVYLVRTPPHFQMICATLTEDYTAVTDEYRVHYDGLLPPLTREAPTYFELAGKRYLFTSGTSGYYPNPSKVCMFDDPHGEYIDLGDPFIGDKSGTSFSSQITSVIQIPGTDRFVACADRWMPQWYVNNPVRFKESDEACPVG